jgi:hypothetical protein
MRKPKPRQQVQTNEAEVSSASLAIDKAPPQMDDEQLAAFVAEHATRVNVYLDKMKPFLVDLRERFRHKERAAKIYDCLTWEEFCRKVFDRTRRAVDYFLAGGNPVSKRKEETVSSFREPEPAHVAVEMLPQPKQKPIRALVELKRDEPAPEPEPPQPEPKLNRDGRVTRVLPEPELPEPEPPECREAREAAEAIARKVAKDIEFVRGCVHSSEREVFDTRLGDLLELLVLQLRNKAKLTA